MRDPGVAFLALLVILALGGLGLSRCEGGAAHDARVAATKQAQIDACAARGWYPALDPRYATVVYCSRTPFQEAP